MVNTVSVVTPETGAASRTDRMRGAVAGDQYLVAALAVFAARVRAAGDGPVADVGCGPGHVTARMSWVSAPSVSIFLQG